MSIQHPHSVGKVRKILLFWTVFHASASGCTKLTLAYAEVINQRRNPSQWEAPEIKPINKTTRDSFQRWTRAYLSTQLSINDIDAFKIITTNAKKPVLVICELKRSNKIPLETWSPYLDDIPNFMLAKACSRKSRDPLNVIDLTIFFDAIPNFV